MNKSVILVDENDNEIDTAEKLEAHVRGQLHRAFSIFIFNKKGELLLQQRAKEKYHSGGLWTNTVCSHPEPQKNIVESVKNRLIEEMGFSTNVKEIYSFLYKSDYEDGLIEHEFDHVFVGFYEENPKPNPDEVMNFKWVSLDEIVINIHKNPENYTSWFGILMKNEEFLQILKQSSHG